MDLEKKRIFLRKRAVKVHSLWIHETVRIIVEEASSKEKEIHLYGEEWISLTFDRPRLHIIVDARSRKRKYYFRETEVNSIDLRPRRIFGSSLMVNLEKEKTSSGEREVKSTHL